MLRVLHQQLHDPYFNIATEEYLLKHYPDDFFVVYRNNPSIVVGKHQNTAAEINHRFVAKQGIPIVRRLSGGGTVYHDLGNINFCFIVSGVEGQLVDFKRFTEPIIDVLQGFGVDAYLGGKNDIRVGDKKISGNAEHVFRNRVIHHGTLLYQSNLDILNESIQVDLDRYHDNAVKSIRSEVANVTEFLPGSMNIDLFEEIMIGYILGLNPEAEDFSLSQSDIEAISSLVSTKYSTWEWNFGYSPTFKVQNLLETSTGKIHVHTQVSKGFIDEVYFALNNDNTCLSDFDEIKNRLVGVKHSKPEITEVLSKIKTPSVLGDIQLVSLTDYFF